MALVYIVRGEMDIIMIVERICSMTGKNDHEWPNL